MDQILIDLHLDGGGCTVSVDCAMVVYCPNDGGHT